MNHYLMESTSDKECHKVFKNYLSNRLRTAVSSPYPVEFLPVSKHYRLIMLKTKIILTVFCYVSQIYHIYGVVKVQQRRLDFDGQELIFGHESFEDGKLTYAVCTNNYTAHEKICKVIREKKPLSNDSFSCNITLKVFEQKKNDTELKNQFGIVPFGKDKAILYFVQRNRRIKSRFNTIQFNGCKVVETNITVSNFVFSKYHIIIIPYNNSYDVVYPTKFKGFQKKTINSNGERIDGPIRLKDNLWLHHFPYILPLSHRSRSKGFVYLAFVYDTIDDYDLIVQKPDGSDDWLGTHSFGLRSIMTVDNDFIGICHDFNYSYSLTRCAQYGVDGKLRFETDLISQDNQTIAFIHNVPGGGLYLFGGQPKNDWEDIDFFIVKLNSTGSGNGTLSLGEMNFEAEALATTFYKNGNSEYCISLADYNSLDMDCENCSNYYIYQTVNCFSESDFS